MPPNTESFVSADGGMEMELKHRLREESKIIGGLPDLRRNREISFDVKVGMLERIVIPTGLGGAESLLLNEKKREERWKYLGKNVGREEMQRIRNSDLK